MGDENFYFQDIEMVDKHFYVSHSGDCEVARNAARLREEELHNYQDGFTRVSQENSTLREKVAQLERLLREEVGRCLAEKREKANLFVKAKREHERAESNAKANNELQVRVSNLQSSLVRTNNCCRNLRSEIARLKAFYPFC